MSFSGLVLLSAAPLRRVGGLLIFMTAVHVRTAVRICLIGSGTWANGLQTMGSEFESKEEEVSLCPGMQRQTWIWASI